MKTLEQEITVSVDDLDELNHVNNVVYVDWAQDIAKNLWNSLVSNEIKLLLGLVRTSDKIPQSCIFKR